MAGDCFDRRAYQRHDNVTEDQDGGTSVTWRTPSAVFAPYGSADLNALARELDPIMEKIVRDAAGN
ncbi:MAG: hypothetical protein HYU75_26345 [Betaproteobacteria bacterium]|nr:hypothetical protein [Betaproteobacteria bacterium]